MARQSATQKRKAKALKITTEVYNKVADRDKGCILCQMLGEHPKVTEAREKGLPVVYECHHYISRGRLGMGIEENLVILCKFHHLEESRYRNEIKRYLKSNE